MATPKQPLDRLRSRKKPVRYSTWIAGDSEHAAEIEQMEQRLLRLRRVAVRRPNGEQEEDASIITLEAQIEEEREKLRATSIKFTFQNLPRKRYEDLLAEHPPTDKQTADAKAENVDLQFNPDTFPLVLIVESCIEPNATKEELKEWLEGDEWNNAELQELFRVAIMANNMRRVVDLGKGSPLTRNSDKN